jgi:acyl-CoA synthetase (AMP-forming)/AMP-acid ligase II
MGQSFGSRRQAGDEFIPSAAMEDCLSCRCCQALIQLSSRKVSQLEVLSHLNIVSAATSITTYLENTTDDIILNVLPLSFDYGLYQILMGFKVGGTVVLERSFTYPHAVLAKMMQESVTGFPIVPTISAILLQMDLTKYHFPCLRYITNTGAALYCSPLRRRTLERSNLWLTHKEVSHEKTPMGCQNQSEDCD